MVWLLIRDMARRKWKWALLAIFQLYNIGHLGASLTKSTDPFAWSLVGAWFMSTTSGPMLQGRELHQLPIPRRTLWLTRWWLATVGAVLISQVGISAGAWSVGFEWPQATSLVLIMIYAFLYCGCDMALQSTSYGRLGERPAIPGKVTSSIGLFLPVWVALAGAPFLFAKYLPHTFAGVTVPWLIILALATSLTVIGYRHRPATVARPSMRIGRSQTDTAALVTRHANFGGRLTGLRMLVWRTVRRDLMTYGLLLASAVIVALTFAPDFRNALRLGCALPFSSHPEKSVEPMVYGTLLTFTAFVDILSAPQLRPLRALPLSTSRLAALPLLLGVVSALTLWAILLVLHLSVLGTDPVSFRFDLFLAVAGTLAAMRSARLALPGSPQLRQMAAGAPAFIGMLAVILTLENSTIVGTAMAVTGVSFMIASFVGTRWSLQRSQSIYKSLSTPVRM
jgi:hypothetical protein